MLIISNETLSKNFSSVEVGEIIKGYFQYLSMMDGKWHMSTYESFEKQPVEFGRIYRKPKNILGVLQIAIPFIKKYFNKILEEVK